MLRVKASGFKLANLIIWAQTILAIYFFCARYPARVHPDSIFLSYNRHQEDPKLEGLKPAKFPVSGLLGFC